MLKRSVLYLLLPLSCIAASEVPQAAANPTLAPTAIVRRGPTISTVTPATVEGQTEVTITGSGFGAEQGASEVWLGATKAAVQSWSDTRIVALPGAGSLTGSVRVLRNGALSNPVPLSGAVPRQRESFLSRQRGSGMIRLRGGANHPGSRLDPGAPPENKAGKLALKSGSRRTGEDVILAPNLLNMVVGDTQTIHALDSAGQPVTGLTWTSSDPAVVSLSTSDPPVLTAEAAGTVTISAGTATAEVTVWSDALPLGTVIWSNPGSGAGVYMIVPAVPSPDGVADVFAFQNDGTVQAITSEGATAWTADITWAWGALPDFQGGLLTVEYDGETESLVRIHGATGQRTVLYSLVSAETNQWVTTVGVHTDGTVFAIRAGGAELERPAVV